MAMKFFDADGNGKVTRKEWNAGFKRIAEKIAQERDSLIARRNMKY